jgi:hypothetical protein
MSRFSRWQGKRGFPTSSAMPWRRWCPRSPRGCGIRRRGRHRPRERRRDHGDLETQRRTQRQQSAPTTSASVRAVGHSSHGQAMPTASASAPGSCPGSGAGVGRLGGSTRDARLHRGVLRVLAVRRDVLHQVALCADQRQTGQDGRVSQSEPEQRGRDHATERALRLNFLPQSGHWKGCSPVCVRMCRFRSC